MRVKPVPRTSRSGFSLQEGVLKQGSRCATAGWVSGSQRVLQDALSPWSLEALLPEALLLFQDALCAAQGRP